MNCTSATFDNLNASDDLFIDQQMGGQGGSGAVPEWDDYAILLILVTVISGFLLVRKK